MSQSAILVVCENQEKRSRHASLIAEHIHGCKVFSVAGPPETTTCLRDEVIDCVLVHDAGEGFCGVELCREIKADKGPFVPVLLVSEHPDRQLRRTEGLEVGAEDVLFAPVDVVEFVTRMRIAVRMKKAEEERRSANEQLEQMVAERTAALLASEERYRQVVELSPDMIAVCEDGRPIYINEAGRSMLGIESPDGMADSQVVKLFQVADEELVERLLLTSTDRGEKVPFHETKLLRPDKKTVDVEISVIPLEYRGKKQVQLIVRDMTDRKRIESQVRQSQRMEAVGKLAGGVAHDFNNVLTTIRGFSELILDSLKQGDPLRDDVDEIRKATERAGALTRQLLAFSRRQVLEPRPLELNTVVSELKRMLKRLIGEDIELVTELSDALGTIKADRSQIEQVIMNLVVNARDAMPEGGRMTVHTENLVLTEDEISKDLELSAGEYVVFTVSDTGVGMSPETMLRIFEPFFTTKANDRGTGLGLSTVYGIVKQSGGDIQVDSELGVGTTFRVYLPRAKGTTGAMDPIRIERGAVRGWETILLVEDENAVRVLVRRMLERAGYTVLTARHGGEAILLCEGEKGPIHLILTDVVMPKIGGRELVERLIRQRPETRILFMSGYNDEEVLRLGELLTHVSFLQKPFSYEQLTQKVRQVLDEPIPEGVKVASAVNE